ncbi:MAG: InlB B-repeat-containing protein [Lachnospiraceae bacterium]|nr:InlB B-repeat-containing protein [Lachnospiraceae bacterium]
MNKAMQKLPFYVLMAFMILFIMPFFGVPLKAKAEAAVHTAHTGSDTDGSKHEGWTPISSEADLKNLGENGGCGYLTKNIELTGFAINCNDTDINLCLNGYCITMTRNYNTLRVSENTILNLYDESANSGIITHGTDCSGNGVFVAGGTFIMYGGTISGNTNYNGSGVYINSGTFTMNGGIISNNSATGSGAVYLTNNSSFIMENGEISNNNSAGNGGAIYIGNSSVTIKNGSITNNKAEYYGGALYVSSNSEVSMTGGSITKNKAFYGGAAYVISESSFKFSGGSIKGNTVTDSGGAVFVYSSGSSFTMDGGSITENTAANNGGAVYVWTSEFNFYGGNISNNSGNYRGGGIYAIDNSNVNINDGYISENTAYFGGGLCCQGSTLTMTGGTISGNSTNKGGGLYLNECSVNISGGTIAGNITSGNGGGVYSINSYLYMDGGKVSDNSAYKGGGLYLTEEYGEGNFIIDGAEINNNQATHGVYYNEIIIEESGRITDDSYKGYIKYDTDKLCVVKYNPNNGTGKPFTQYYKKDSDASLIENEFTRSGYEFYNWNTKFDGSGESYDDNVTIENPICMELYAQWKPNEYTVKFDANGGYGKMTSQNIKFNTSTVLNTNSFTRNGYEFNGWNTKADGSGTSYSDAAKIKLNTLNNNKVTLYAQWKAKYATVKLNVNGGTALTESTLKVQEYTAYGELPKATRTGYTFNGWYTAKSGGTKVTADSICEGNITLYAHWKAKTNTKYKVEHYKQKLDGKYSSKATDTEELKGTTNASVTPEVKTYTGFTSPEVQTETIKADGSLVIQYYYTRNSYKLTWNLDGGTAAYENYSKGNVKYGEAITAPIPTKKGYTFAGWNVTVPEKMPAKKLTIKALWEAKYATVKLNVNGGNALTESTVKVQEYTAYGELPKTTRTGYTFNGWYTAKSGGTKVTAESICEGNITLYAHWKAKTNTKYKVEHYKQKLDGNYPAKASETEALTGKTNASITPEVKTYTGFTAPELQTVKISADGKLVVKYYYTRNSYKLTWDLAGGKASGTYTKGTVLYGAKITAPVPERDGYVFKGWDKTVAEKMPANDVTYKATWRKLTQKEKVSKFVERFYTIILERPAEAEGLENWTNKLINKEATGAQVAAGFINSDEFQKKKMTDEEYVTKLYRAFFDREPDKGGYDGWLRELKNGKSRDEVLRGFINSPEFNDLCKQYGIDAGTY